MNCWVFGRVQRLSWYAVLGGVLAGCGDGGSEPAGPAVLEVTVSTAGPVPDPDGYILTVDGGGSRSIPTNGTTRFEGLEPGTHIVALSGLSANCFAAADAQSVILAGAPASLTFSVNCIRALDDQIAFHRAGPTVGSGTIYVMNRDGSSQTSLASGIRPSVSADGLIVAFLRNRGDGLLQILLMLADGTDQHAITPCPGTVCDWEDVAWGPDRTKLAAYSFFAGVGCISALSPTGESFGLLTPSCSGRDDRDPAWARDGRFAFSSNRDGNYEIYAAGADGSNPLRLTNDPASDNQPAWSPDGQKIAFVSDRDGNREIYTMNADGSGVTRRTHHAGADGEPTWAPDGTRIAFTTDRDGNREIYSMNPDGTGLINLTNDPADDLAPDWSRAQ